MADKKVRVEISADGSGLEKAFINAADAVNKASNSLEQFKAKASNASRSVQNMAGNIAASSQKIASASQKATNAIDDIGKSIQAVTAIAAVQAISSITSSITSLGVHCIKAAGQMEQYEIAFQTMLKSADRGTKMLRDLQEFAAKTPFDVPGVVETAQQLMAFGFSAEKIIPTLRTLGDAAAGLGKGTVGVQQMGYALGQISTSGTLKTQDVNQLTNAGINVWQFLADSYGKTISEIKEMTEKGMIESADAMKIITEGMNENFGGMMQKMEGSINGLLANIEETAGNFAADMGGYFVDAFDIKDKLAGLGQALTNISESFRKAKQEGKSLSEAIVDAVPPGVIVAAGALATVVGVVLVAAVVAAVGAIAGIIGISAPAIAAIAALGGAIAFVITYWDELVDAVSSAARIACAAVLSVFVGLATGVGSILVGLADFIAETIGEMWDKAMGYTPEWVSDVKNACDKALAAIKEWAGEALSYISKVFSKQQSVTPEIDTDSWSKKVKGFEIPELFKDKPIIPKATPNTTPNIPTNITKGTKGISEQEMAVKQLVKQWTNSDKVAKRYAETTLKASEANASMLLGEANKLAELNNKLDANRISHEAVLNGLKEEIDLAQKIGDADTRLKVIDNINKQIDAENKLYAAKQKAAKFKYDYQALQDSDKDMLDKIFGDQDVFQERIRTNKENLSQCLEEINAIIADAGNKNINSGSLFNGMSSESMDFISKVLNVSPDALEEEFAAKTDGVTTFVDFLKEKLAEGVEAQNETLSVGAQWAQKQEEWLGGIGKSMGSAVSEWVMGSKSIGRAMADMVRSLISQAATLLAQWYAVFAVMSIWHPDGYSAAQAADKIVLGIDHRNIKARAKGGRAHGLTLVGEEGPELVNFKNPGMVYTAGQTESILNSNMSDMSNYKDVQNIPRAKAEQASSGANSVNNNSVNLTVSAIDANSFNDFLRTGGLDTLRQALFDNNREFGDVAGVW